MPLSDIPKPYLIEIGRIIVSWNELESVLGVMLPLLAGMDITDDRSNVMFPNMSFPQKINAFLAFVELSTRKNNDLDRLAHAKRVYTEMDRLNRLRNTTVHHSWHVNADGVQQFNVSAKGKLIMDRKFVKLDQMKKISHEIDEVIGELVKVCAFTIYKSSPAKGAVAKALSQNS